MSSEFRVPGPKLELWYSVGLEMSLQPEGTGHGRRVSFVRDVTTADVSVSAFTTGSVTPSASPAIDTDTLIRKRHTVSLPRSAWDPGGGIGRGIVRIGLDGGDAGSLERRADQACEALIVGGIPAVQAELDRRRVVAPADGPARQILNEFGAPLAERETPNSQLRPRPSPRRHEPAVAQGADAVREPEPEHGAREDAVRFG